MDSGFSTAAISESATSSTTTSLASEAGWSNTKSLKFTGSSSTRVEIDAAPVTAYPWSISFWMKTSNSAAMNLVFMGDKDVSTRYYRLYLETTPRIRLQARNTTAYTTTYNTNLYDGSWHHIVFVATSNTNRTLYIDGSLVATQTNNVSFPSQTDRFGVGRLGYSSPTSYFTGNLDEVAVWSTNLSALDIAQLYNSGTPFDISSDYGFYSASSSLVLYWRMGDDANDDPSGTGNIEDQVGANAGTAVNFSASDVEEDVP